MKRKGTINHQFNQRIPADVKARAVGLKLYVPMGDATVVVRVTERMNAIRLSLGSCLPCEVKHRQAQIIAYLENVWSGLRNSLQVALTHKQATALAREIYEGWADETKQRTFAVTRRGNTVVPTSDTFIEGDGYLAVLEALDRRDALGREPEEAMRPLVRQRLIERGLGVVDEPSLELVVREYLRAFRDAIALRARQAEGDYSPDPNANRFPDLVLPSRSPSRSRDFVSLTGLVEDWWKEAKAGGRSVSTYESYKSSVCRLADFLKHDNALAVTPADIVSFKDYRLAQNVSPKTVGDSDIAGLRSIFKWAVGNLKLPSNPAEKVAVTRPKMTRTRERSFTPTEAEAILSHSLHHPSGRHAPKMRSAYRWVPWLCAYTGARLGEIVQLRKHDLREDGGTWIVTITPEAGTVKDKEVREVVLHSHLIEQGFVEFLDRSPDGFLFMEVRKEGGERGVWRTVKNRLREFAREVVKDPNVAPNHGWRHLFKTIGREAGIADSVLDGICGHAAKTVGGAYGNVTLKAQREAFDKFPRFEVS